MDFKDISDRMKKARGADTQSQQKAFDPIEAYRIRGKMLGVLLRDARMSAARTVEDCARMLKVTVQEFESWEYGDVVPSLPQLEMLAYYLDVPISHFWGMETMQNERNRDVDVQQEYINLRSRMIGALLQQARDEAKLSLEELSEATALPVEKIETYELGESHLPAHELISLASALKKNMDFFLEADSHVGELLATREEWKHFADLPEDLRQFAANPLNLGFIEIALMLSQMPTEKLRRVGESVLNITM
jgi:transcriptional regulator with XRE-family HTH domain